MSKFATAKTLIENLHSTIAKLEDDLEDLESTVETLEEESGSEDTSNEIKLVQGRIRTPGVLHLQYGTNHDYKKADVTISPDESDKIYNYGLSHPGALVGSLAGSGSKYLPGTYDTVGRITIGGVTIQSPFWSPKSVPNATPKSAW